MHDAGCLGLVHWDDPEGWYGDLVIGSPKDSILLTSFNMMLLSSLEVKEGWNLHGDVAGAKSRVWTWERSVLRSKAWLILFFVR